MKYDPPELRIGWIITLMGAFALASLSAFEWRRKWSAMAPKTKKD
jgi:hypothetical protein